MKAQYDESPVSTSLIIYTGFQRHWGFKIKVWLHGTAEEKYEA